jgi:hypothetical protein
MINAFRLEYVGLVEFNILYVSLLTIKNAF